MKMRVRYDEVAICNNEWNHTFYESPDIADGVLAMSQFIRLHVDFDDGYEDCVLWAREYVFYRGGSAYGNGKKVDILDMMAT